MHTHADTKFHVEMRACKRALGRHCYGPHALGVSRGFLRTTDNCPERGSSIINPESDSHVSKLNHILLLGPVWAVRPGRARPNRRASPRINSSASGARTTRYCPTPSAACLPRATPSVDLLYTPSEQTDADISKPCVCGAALPPTQWSQFYTREPHGETKMQRQFATSRSSPAIHEPLSHPPTWQTTRTLR